MVPGLLNFHNMTSDYLGGPLEKVVLLMKKMRLKEQELELRVRKKAE